ncbi:DUF1360 domain-containing protein [Ornithinibacillus sp. 179-J 7C1 HS]|uniref:DUF1360 domain-containing protein n=1 Tax=Ornithinibacillus sp. 179-J 7C1 HS TaxID=3142384 RepID=UPI0039A02C04
MIDSWLEFVLLVLASFRLTRLIVFDKITSFLRRPFHEEIEEIDEEGNLVTYIEVKGNGLRYWIGELISCYWCTGIWSTAILLAIFILWPSWSMVVITLLAIAGAASICEAILQRIID